MNKIPCPLKRIALAISFLYFININAQTNPTAQNLPYSQSFGTTTFNSMPAGAASWGISGAPVVTQSGAESSSPNMNAAITGVTSAQSSAASYGYCTSANGKFYIQTGNSTSGTNQLVCAINTSGYKNILVSYNVEMISAALLSGAVLQYRVGTTGTWTSISGSVYSHSSSDRSVGSVDNFTNLAIPIAAENLPVIQLRWATWRSSSLGSSSGIAIDNISISATPNQVTGYFRSKQNGNWNSVSTWETSSNNTTWVNASVTPKYTASSITIQSSHNVTITATDTIDQVIVDGKLTYSDVAGSTPRINNGPGSDLIVNGTFEDFGPNSIVWAIKSSWNLGSTGTIIRTRSTSANNWHTNYLLGNTVPATANWIIRKTGTDNPEISSLAGTVYPNLIYENYTTSIWITSSTTGFGGVSAPPVIKGNLSIGGNGTGNVSLLNDNLNANAINVDGKLAVNLGSILRNYGTGIQLQGDLESNGTFDYGSGNATLIFSGINNQNVISETFISLKNIKVNKTNSSNYVTLQCPLNITGTLTFVLGYIVSSSINPLTFNSGSNYLTAGNNSYVSGPVKKIGNTAFTFPTGKNNNYQPLTISAPTNSLATYSAEYFNINHSLGGLSDVTIDSVSNCEYWEFSNVGYAYPVYVEIGIKPGISCRLAPTTEYMRLTRWNGTQWADLGNSSSLSNLIRSETTVNNFGLYTYAQRTPREDDDIFCDPSLIPAPTPTGTCELICNGNFESHWADPFMLSLMSVANCWNKAEYDPINNPGEYLCCTPTYGTPDYFTDDYIPTSGYCASVDVPNNFAGIEPSHASGNSYAGILAYVTAATNTNWINPLDVGYNYREYIQQKLSAPLVPGLTYNFSMWVSLSDNSAVGTYLGVLFTTSQVNGMANPLSITPQYETPTIITEKNGWTLVTFCFTPTIAYEWVVIGNYRQDAVGNINAAYPGTIVNAYDGCTPRYQKMGYYYIDDVSMTPQPFEITATPSPVCVGSPIQLEAAQIPSDCSSSGPAVTWSSTPLSSISPTVGASSTAIVSTPGIIDFTGTITHYSGCTESHTVPVTVLPLPNVTVNSPTICRGQVANLTASGATSYTWSAGVTVTGTSTANASPVFTTTYTVTGTTNGCSKTAVATVTVIQPPSVVVNSPNICPGGTANLIANGASVYTWSSGVTVTGLNTASASPSTTTSYTVTGTSSGCSSTAISTVTVNAIPTVTVSNSGISCAQSLAILTANGATSYTWSAGATSTGINTATVSPSVTTTYTVTGSTSGNGCSATAVSTVTVISGTAPWPKAPPGTSGHGIATGIGRDNFGNTFIAGFFSGPTTFGCCTSLNPTYTLNTQYLAKYNDCDDLLWVKTIANMTNDSQGKIHDISVDENGDSYILGSFSGTVDFGSGIILTGPTAFNMFGSTYYIAKYDSNGNVLQVEIKSGSPADIALDELGHLYIIRTVSSAFQLEKYSTTNFTTPLWVRNVSGVNGIAVATDNIGNVYVTGALGSGAVFGGTAAPLFGFGLDDIFLVKYDSNGNALWAISGGSANFEYGEDVYADQNGNVYISGVFRNVDAGPSPSTLNIGGQVFTTQNASHHNKEWFTAKFDVSGNAIWAKPSGGLSGSYMGGIEPWFIQTNVVADDQGNAYMAATFSTSSTFGPLGTLTSTGSHELYVVKYNNVGTEQWVKQTGNGYFSYVHDQINLAHTGIAIDPISGLLFTSGFYKLTVPFNISITSASSPNGSNSMGLNIFAARLEDYTSYGNYRNYDEPAVKKIIEDKGLLIFPNPTDGQFTIQNNQEENVIIEIWNSYGVKVHKDQFLAGREKLNLNLDEQVKGIYFVIMKINGNLEVRKLIKN